MTLDEIVAQGKLLSYDDLLMVASAFNQEAERRRDKERAEAWVKVCNAIDNYVGNYGYFTIFVGGDAYTIYRGDYAFDEGEISFRE